MIRTLFLMVFLELSDRNFLNAFPKSSALVTKVCSSKNIGFTPIVSWCVDIETSIIIMSINFDCLI